MFFKEVFGIDLGSDTVKIYSLKKDEILIEKNMIAIRDGDEVIAVGNDAYEMYEKSPRSITVSSPMNNGMIANIGHLEVVLHVLLRKVSRRFRKRPIVYFSAPVNMSEIEKRAYHAVASGGDLRNSRIFLVERPIVHALANGIPIMKSKGSMIADLGAESTELSIIADNRVIISKLVLIGGNDIDQAIIDQVRKNCSLGISHRTAIRLKTALAGFVTDQGDARKVVGVDMVSGLPREAIVPAKVVNDAMRSVIDRITDAILQFLEQTPPQIQNNILKEGICITGGCTKIEGLAPYLAGKTSCAVRKSQYADLSDVYGLKEIITHKALQHWAVSAKSRRNRYRY